MYHTLLIKTKRIQKGKTDQNNIDNTNKNVYLDI